MGEAIVGSAKCEIGKIIIGKAHILIGQCSANRTNPVIVGDCGTVYMDDKRNIVLLGQTEGFFQQTGIGTMAIDRASLQPQIRIGNSL